MPCYDSRSDYFIREIQIENPKIAAALCALLSVGGTTLLDKVDWREAGIDRDYVEGWWKNHKAKDAARKAREAEVRHTNKLKATAIGKLTIEEQRVLGLRRKR